MGNIARFLIRSSAFLRKEIFEILRQPRLIATLVLGPFLILLLFGVGYRNEAPVLDTIFVVQPGSTLEQEIDEYASSLGEQLNYVGSTTDLEGALGQLSRGQVDLIAVAPVNAYTTIRDEQEQAVFTLYHNEIDPLQSDYVRYFGKIYIDEVNRRVLQTITEEGQEQSVSIRERSSAARQESAAMHDALERGDLAEARRHQIAFDRELYRLETDLTGTVDLLENVEGTLGNGETSSTQPIRDNLTAVRQSQTELGEIGDDPDASEEQLQEISALEDDLEELDTSLGDFQQINSRVLVSPFRSETKSIAPPTQLAHYFAPAVIVLLLQHLAVTFGALSIVREIQIGTVELFRVSPISPIETLVGKYLSYLLFGGVIAAILTGVMIAGLVLPISGLESILGGGDLTLGLGVPMRGDWLYYALAVLCLLFTSLGLGFVISLIVDTDSQAVQYSMIILLTSVFFSGVFLRLETLWEPVRVVSWMLPATYAIQMLQTIMLRGLTPSWTLLASLFGIGVALYLLAWFLLSRQMKRGYA